MRSSPPSRVAVGSSCWRQALSPSPTEQRYILKELVERNYFDFALGFLSKSFAARQVSLPLLAFIKAVFVENTKPEKAVIAAFTSDAAFLKHVGVHFTWREETGNVQQLVYMQSRPELPWGVPFYCPNPHCTGTQSDVNPRMKKTEPQYLLSCKACRMKTVGYIKHPPWISVINKFVYCHPATIDGVEAARSLIGRVPMEEM
ncbi:uncharacterized protein B0H18DRAFT_1215226, partial [Fomitopsis serialis]|uniref:uncharacterized protein n=1 Tax=Fomitopsis serialis TaxID=139415 RepID=UPI0020081779